MKFVCRDFRDGVRRLLIGDGRSDDAPDIIHDAIDTSEMRIGAHPAFSSIITINILDMCSSAELLSWAFAQGGCPFRGEAVCEAAVSCLVGGADALKVARFHGCD
jgi:hypothetical protein